METKLVEQSELIAIRVPPGDRWNLVTDTRKIIHESLTEVLEAYFNASGFKGEYRLAPLDSKLYAIKEIQEKIIPEEPKTFNIYGDPI